MSLDKFRKKINQPNYDTFVLPVTNVEMKFIPFSAFDAADQGDLPSLITNQVLEAMSTGSVGTDYRGAMTKEEYSNFLERVTHMFKKQCVQPLTEEEEEGRIDEDGNPLENLPKANIQSIEQPSPLTDDEITTKITTEDRIAWFTYAMEKSYKTKTKSGREVTSKELGNFSSE